MQCNILFHSLFIVQFFGKKVIFNLNTVHGAYTVTITQLNYGKYNNCYYGLSFPTHWTPQPLSHFNTLNFKEGCTHNPNLNSGKGKQIFWSPKQLK